MPITERITKRVETTGATGAVPASLGTDTWGNTWGGTWGNTWLYGTPATDASGESPAVDVTARVTGTISLDLTVRVTIPQFLELEGDYAGFDLLFENGDLFQLEDGARPFVSSATKRVTA